MDKILSPPRQDNAGPVRQLMASPPQTLLIVEKVMLLRGEVCLVVRSSARSVPGRGEGSFNRIRPGRGANTGFGERRLLFYIIRSDVLLMTHTRGKEKVIKSAKRLPQDSDGHLVWV